MIKRIAIFPSHSGFSIPDEFKSKITDDERNWRLVLAEIIDKLEDTHSEINDDILLSFSKSPFNRNNWYIKCGDIFYFKNKNNSRFMYKVKIFEVDTTCKWKIEEYDGFESVVYFNEPVLVDEDLNMYNW